ncbi:MAG: tetratricopeptide repeat protein [Cyclobacteriaceae bacterium]
MKYFSLSILLIRTLFLGAQDLDSLKMGLAQAESDSLKHYYNIEIGYVLMFDYPDSARNYFLKGLSYSQKLEQKAKIASSLTLTGVTYYLNGQFEEAMRYYLKALAISQRTEDNRYTGIISNNIGAVYFEMKEYEKAESHYGNAISLFEVAEDTFWLSNALNNMGNVLEKTEQYEPALTIYKKSLSLAEISGNEEAIGSAMGNLGNVYMALGRDREALQQYRQGVLYQKNADDRIAEAISYNNIGRLLGKEGRYTEAVLNHKKALSIAEEIGHLETLKNGKKWLGDVYNKMGLFEKAYETQNEFIVLSDSLVGLEKAKAVEELNQKYESELKERTIAELELDKKNAALALAKSNNQRNTFIFIALLIVFIAVFLYYLYNTKRKTSDILAIKNNQISKALDEREVLLKEIHHRVKNNLQVVWSLLRLQGRSLNNEVAREALTQGQNRVKSMALVHQRLYSTDDLRGVSVQDYFEKLTSELFMAFGVSHVDYKVETSHIKLDIDTMVPLGLIVNELMTNAIKYAFPEEKEGGLVELTMSEESDKLVVRLRDNGVGMDEESLKKGNSFGWKMIRSLSRELKAEIEILNNNGTTINLSLSRYKLVV